MDSLSCCSEYIRPRLTIRSHRLTKGSGTTVLQRPGQNMGYFFSVTNRPELTNEGSHQLQHQSQPQSITQYSVKPIEQQGILKACYVGKLSQFAMLECVKDLKSRNGPMLVEYLYPRNWLPEMKYKINCN